MIDYNLPWRRFKHEIHLPPRLPQDLFISVKWQIGTALVIGYNARAPALLHIDKESTTLWILVSPPQAPYTMSFLPLESTAFSCRCWTFLWHRLAKLQFSGTTSWYFDQKIDKTINNWHKYQQLIKISNSSKISNLTKIWQKCQQLTKMSTVDKNVNSWQKC